jgi:hypothetical protein
MLSDDKQRILFFVNMNNAKSAYCGVDVRSSFLFLFSPFSKLFLEQTVNNLTQN